MMNLRAFSIDKQKQHANNDISLFSPPPLLSPPPSRLLLKEKLLSLLSLPSPSEQQPIPLLSLATILPPLLSLCNFLGHSIAFTIYKYKALLSSNDSWISLQKDLSHLDTFDSLLLKDYQVELSYVLDYLSLFTSPDDGNYNLYSVLVWFSDVESLEGGKGEEAPLIWKRREESVWRREREVHQKYLAECSCPLYAFYPLLVEFLILYPGLVFLRTTPLFQNRYAETVLSRILYNTRDVYDAANFDLQDCYYTNVGNVWCELNDPGHLNRERKYFSYEHFYVLYCTFWDLDSNKDFFITKSDFAKYDSDGLSDITVERVFDRLYAKEFFPPREYKIVPSYVFPNVIQDSNDMMSFHQFIFFLLMEQDKSHLRAIHFWFAILDVTHDDLIDTKDIEFVFIQQEERLRHHVNDTINYKDIVCQFNDLLQPAKPGCFTIEDFKKSRKLAFSFVNSLTNLTKYLMCESNDNFNLITDNDGTCFNSWDRFCDTEYLKLAVDSGCDDM